MLRHQHRLLHVKLSENPLRNHVLQIGKHIRRPKKGSCGGALREVGQRSSHASPSTSSSPCQALGEPTAESRAPDRQTHPATKERKLWRRSERGWPAKFACFAINIVFSMSSSRRTHCGITCSRSANTSGDQRKEVVAAL